MHPSISVTAQVIEALLQRQGQSKGLPAPMAGRRDPITPNPKLKLLDQVREVAPWVEGGPPNLNLNAVRV
jgi:hypothetical protein